MTTLLVHNLRHIVDTDDLSIIFGQYGPLLNVNIDRCVGVITFMYFEDAMDAIDHLQGLSLYGRLMDITLGN